MSARNNIPTSVPTDIFTPTEHAILAAYLNIAAPVNTSAVGELLYDHREGRAEGEGVGLLPDAYGHEDQWFAVNNAVARIALSGIQNRLPHWGSSTDTQGRPISAREVYEGDAKVDREVPLIPQHLFTINWGTSEAGFYWPEAYHVCFIPCYDVWVVTASKDSPGTHFYCDRTLGWFAGDKDPVESAKGILVKEWEPRRDIADRPRWEELLAEGLLDVTEANLWADEVWPPEPLDGEPNRIRGDESEAFHPRLPPVGDGSFRDQIVADLQKEFPDKTEEEIIEEAGGLI